MLPKHGGYRHLKTFQIAEVIYDVTLRFCDRYVDPRSRTHDQMVQAARSGRQNLAEGSVDSATSKKIEMKLTGVAKGSLEELLLDYEDFLRQHGLEAWPPEHPALQRFRARRCTCLAEFIAWVADERQRLGGQLAKSAEPHGRAEPDAGTTDRHGPTRTLGGPGTTGPVGLPVRVRPCPSVPPPSPPSPLSPPSPSSSLRPPATTRGAPPSAVIAANGALSLLNLCVYLVGRQVESQAATFEREGGFTERLYRHRQQHRQTEGD